MICCITNQVLDELERRINLSKSMLQLACYLDYRDVEDLKSIIQELKGYREAVKQVYGRE